MRTTWGDSASEVTGSEADQVVDLWLRRRLAPECAPAASTPLTARDIAQALGTGEAEVEALLTEIRTRKKPRKQKPAISVARSWRLIVGIYTLAILCGLVWWVPRMARPSYVSYTPAYPYYTTEVAGRAMTQRLPRGFGMTYRSVGEGGASNVPAEQLDWVKAEKAILSQISTANGGDSLSYQPDISQEAITQALANKPTGPGGPANGWTEEGIPLVNWNDLQVTVEGQMVHADIPSAAVANQALEKGVQAETKKLLEGILADLRSRVSPDSLRADKSESRL